MRYCLVSHLQYSNSISCQVSGSYIEIIFIDAEDRLSTLCINISYFGSFICFLLSWLISPGHLKSQSQDPQNLSSLLAKFDSKCICPYC
jgi:hypothetical protein